MINSSLGQNKPKYLWHCTRLELIENILINGLVAQNPTQREQKPKGVYLSEYQFNWMWNTTREGIFKGAILKIDVRGLKLVKDFHEDPKDTQYNSKRIGTDYISLEDIEPHRIKEVWIETEANTFQPMQMGAKSKHGISSNT